MLVTFPTEEGVKYLVGNIRGYDRNGVWYDQEDGDPFIIDGRELLEQVLEQMHEVTKYEVGNVDTEVDINIMKAWDFLQASGYVPMDYTEEDTEEFIKDDPLGILTSIQHEYVIRVDPYSYAKEVEQESFEEDEDLENL